MPQIPPRSQPFCLIAGTLIVAPNGSRRAVWPITDDCLNIVGGGPIRKIAACCNNRCRRCRSIVGVVGLRARISRPTD
ncbi:unnamed protein product [Protopolystoma xenopodis]|uniref:Uncharacterized protein n=1 Tax=Protopolystoma xenopodis TaxID=117903 RepID=A0A448WSR9_9PLAT|nr:unnamed protein product [Protopolystoma xenopodis]